MNRAYYVKCLKDLPEYKWVLITHLNTMQAYGFYKTRKEAVFQKSMEDYPCTIVGREEFIKTYGG